MGPFFYWMNKKEYLQNINAETNNIFQDKKVFSIQIYTYHNDRAILRALF